LFINNLYTRCLLREAILFHYFKVLAYLEDLAILFGYLFEYKDCFLIEKKLYLQYSFIKVHVEIS